MTRFFSVPLAVLFAFCATHTAAHADLWVTFQEDAPKDRFIVTNQGACSITAFDLEINLKGSQGRLMFDTTGAGWGVNVYQPFEIASGKNVVSSLPQVDDGDERVVIGFKGLAPDEPVVFTVDVDDNVPSGPLGSQMIGLSEIVGASARLNRGQAPSDRATFNHQGTAVISQSGC